MLKKLGYNLNFLMSEAGIKTNDLAKQTGLPATTIKSIRNNENANPTISTLLPLAKFFSIPLSKLIGSEELDINTSINSNYIKQVPLLTWEKCGEDLLLNRKTENIIFTERNISTKAFALFVENDNLKSFPHGGILIIEPEKRPETNDIVIVARIDNPTASIRKYVVEIDQAYLIPLVSGFSVSPMSSEFRILGVVIQYKFDFQN